MVGGNGYRSLTSSPSSPLAIDHRPQDIADIQFDD